MTAKRRGNDERETDARLTGLIPRLTAPSRNYGTLVDIWFGIERAHRSAEWDEVFARIAEGWRPDPRQPSYFDLFSHPSSSALIVARQVSADRVVWRAAEEEARALVKRVNRAMGEAQRVPEERPPLDGLLARGVRGAASATPSGSWLGDALQLVRSLVPKPELPVSQGSSSGVR